VAPISDSIEIEKKPFYILISSFLGKKLIEWKE
jgi:hypothetical protein